MFLHTCMPQVWFIIKQILDLEVRNSHPFFGIYQPLEAIQLHGEGGQNTELRTHCCSVASGSISDYYRVMTLHLVRGYGQRITKAIFLDNSFYLLICLVKHLGFSPDSAYTFGKLALLKFGQFVNSKLKGLGNRKCIGYLVERWEKVCMTLR